MPDQHLRTGDQYRPTWTYQLSTATGLFRLANDRFDPFVIDQLMTNLNLLMTLLDQLMTSSNQLGPTNDSPWPASD